MSIQHPTPRYFVRWGPVLVVALGLSALVWSCESEQVGYEVTLPLIGPIDFNEMSCDQSGDLCSTDSDCFDEDGIPVGPCTRTLTPFEPITVAVALSPSAPSYTFPFEVDTDRWVSPLTVLANGGESPISLTSENFSVTGGPVTLNVRPFSRNGLYLGQDAGYQPVAPSTGSCTFTLTDSSTGEDYSNGITTCLADWLEENGTPVEFDIEVTSSAGGAPAAAEASAKSGFAPKQANYFVSGGDSWDTKDRCEGQVDFEVLDAVGEGSDFFSLLSCNALGFSGKGNSSVQIEVFGVAGIFDACGTWLAFGSLGSSIGDTVTVGPGDFSVTVYDSENFTVGPDDVPVVMLPTPEGFIQLLLLAGSGECLLGGTPPLDPFTNEPREGLAIVGWEHCAEEEGQRDGFMEYTASGFCPVAGDSSDGGTDDGGTGDGGTGDGGTGDGGIGEGSGL